MSAAAASRDITQVGVEAQQMFLQKQDTSPM